MSVVLICDVCDEQFAPDTDVARVLIPSVWLAPEGDEDTVPVDVCSLECLANMGVRLMGGVDEAVEPPAQQNVAGPAEKPQDDGMGRERFSSLPETARVQYQDPTGVRIKTLGGQQ